MSQSQEHNEVGPWDGHTNEQHHTHQFQITRAQEALVLKFCTTCGQSYWLRQDHKSKQITYTWVAIEQE